MRYYDIKITQPNSSTIYRPPGWETLNLQTSYTSFVNGKTLPGALDIELDMSVSYGGTPAQTGAWVRVWGVSLREIMQATNLNGYGIQVSGGMKPGLPLASAAANQAGVLITGQIMQAFGNWIGTDMTLDFIIAASGGNATPVGAPQGSPDQPINLVLNWPPGTALGSAIQNALQTAFPKASPAPTIQVNGNLTMTQDGSTRCSDVYQLSDYVRRMSKRIVNNSNYAGVQIVPQGNTFLVTDGSQASGNIKHIAFEDLIGQPTWYNPFLVQAKTALRGDLSPGMTVIFPAGTLATIQPQQPAVGQLYNRNTSIFQGTFIVQSVRHIGRYRQADAASWVTVINATSDQLFNANDQAVF